MVKMDGCEIDQALSLKQLEVENQLVTCIYIYIYVHTEYIRCVLVLYMFRNIQS